MTTNPYLSIFFTVTFCSDLSFVGDHISDVG
jgi:hypothetical protein